MDTYTAQQVFTPGSYPSATYVARAEQQHEKRLRDALNTPGQIVALIGPSKSGKTVLVENVVGPNHLISVSGGEMKSSEDLWRGALNAMGMPDETVEKSSTGKTTSGSGQAQVPLFARVTASFSRHRQTSVESRVQRSGMQQVIKGIGGSEFVLLLDDLHYVERHVQEEIAEQCKEGVRQGVRICLASVPHRADDVIRANPDLRGRVLTLDLEYWNERDLRHIAVLGFPLLNMYLDDGVLAQFARESAGSPQLMQAICLNACFVLNVHETLPCRTEFTPSAAVCNQIFEQTSALANFASFVDVMRRGPKERGVSRLSYRYKGDGGGDVYECIIEALRADPPRLSFPYAELKDRLESLCADVSPRGVAIVQSIGHMYNLTKSQMPRERAIDWDEERQVLDIVDPYLLFYLRWS